MLRLAAGVQLDLNGVVKALAVDRAAALLDGDGFVSAGGDLATRGAVDVALSGGDAVRVSGGLATSGTTRRRWLRAGEPQHHLIDPRTGRPSDTPWSEVTVCGATCLAADVAAKAALLLGADGPAWLERRGLPGRFVGAETRHDRRVGGRAPGDVVHLTSSPVDWYAARAAGVVAYVLLTVVVSFGLTMSSRRRLERWPRFALEEVHRFGGILVGTFIAIHVVDDRDRLVSALFADRDRRALRRVLPARCGSRSGSSPPSCCSRSRSRIACATGCPMRAGVPFTTRTSRSGRRRRCTASRAAPTGAASG